MTLKENDTDASAGAKDAPTSKKAAALIDAVATEVQRIADANGWDLPQKELVELTSKIVGQIIVYQIATLPAFTGIVEDIQRLEQRIYSLERVIAKRALTAHGTRKVGAFVRREERSRTGS